MEEANDIPATFFEPVLGSWVLFHSGKIYSPFGHSGIVMSIGTSTIKVLESNFYKGKISVREISIKDKNIRGYFK